MLNAKGGMDLKVLTLYSHRYHVNHVVNVFLYHTPFRTRLTNIHSDLFTPQCPRVRQ